MTLEPQNRQDYYLPCMKWISYVLVNHGTREDMPIYEPSCGKVRNPVFVPCQREQCMGWVTEYRMAPTGIVPAHCKMIGLEGGM